MWFAVLGYVKLFPNLEAALKGIFNRVLKNLRKASARFHTEKFAAHTRGVLEKIARHAGLCPDTRGSHEGLSCSQLMSKITSTTPMAPLESPSEPSPSPDSRSSCDGWRPKPRHDGRPRVPAHSLRAYQPASPVNLAKMARQRVQQRWRRAAHAHCQAGARYAW